MTNDKFWAVRMPSDMLVELHERARQDERSAASAMRLLARMYIDSESMDQVDRLLSSRSNA